jgi:anti-anti-sigma regulatory factor
MVFRHPGRQIAKVAEFNRLVVELENAFDCSAAFRLLGAIDGVRATEVRLDFSRVESVHGAALPVLAAVVRRLSAISEVQILGLPAHHAIALEQLDLGSAAIRRPGSGP